MLELRSVGRRSKEHFEHRGELVQRLHVGRERGECGGLRRQVGRSGELRWASLGRWGRARPCVKEFVFALNTVGSNRRISGMRMVGSDLCVEMIILVASGDQVGGRQERREEGPMRRWLHRSR